MPQFRNRAHQYQFTTHKSAHFKKNILNILVFASFAFLSACGGGSTSPTEVAADFNVSGVKGTVSGQNVSIDLSGLGNCATNIENMVIGINANGASISPDPRIARDYSQPVQFTLTAPDGTKVIYTVTVNGAACLSNSPTTAPTPTPTPTPTACNAAPILASEPYSLVFKGCDANNVATYYDKTECVRQNSTGLIWQGQTAIGTGLRANEQYKTNYDSTTELQKSIGVGSPIAPTQTEIDATTNSVGFKNAVNATNLCGSGAWRLPTKDELLGIVKINATAPMIDTDWFPNTPQYGWYWSASPYPGNAYYAWGVSFYDGIAYDGGRDSSYGDHLLVRLVK
jgi:hypothetical protein